MDELKLLIEEVIEDIEICGADYPALLFSERTRPENIIDYLLADDANDEAVEEGLHIEETRTPMPLFQVLIEMVNAYKNMETKKHTPYISAVVTAARNVARLSQKQLAEKINVNTRTVEVWERGTDTPSLAEVIKIMTACGVNSKYALQYIR